MKDIFSALKVSLFILTIISFHSCKKDTKEDIPTLTTSNITSISATLVISGGTITDEGSSAIISRGVCWSTGLAPTISDSKTTDGIGEGSFTSNITGFTANTEYNVRAYATNKAGISYGEGVAFNVVMNMPGPVVADIDGNSYSSVKIGTQIWMAENLKATKYKDGSTIPLVNDNTSWEELSSPGYCWYNNDAPINKHTYGALYNAYTVISDKLCPAGWHVPSDGEWAILIEYLGVAGSLMEAGTDHWDNPNTLATNESGFTALPGGLRIYDGPFNSVGNQGFWWSSTEGTPDGNFAYYLNKNDENVHRDNIAKRHGFSVRCIKDN